MPPVKSQASQQFVQARLKCQWAIQHIDWLYAAWTNFLETDFCQLKLEDHPDGGQSLRVVSTGDLPAELVLRLGDAIHNFRSALDYITSKIIGWKSTNLNSSMEKEQEKLIERFRAQPERMGGKNKRKGRYADLEESVAGIGEFIVDEIRPYKDGNNYLWPLSRLDNRDKHRLLIPVLVPQTISGIDVVDRNGNRASLTGTVGPGGVVNLIHFGAGGVRVERYGKPTAEMFFDEPGVVESEPVFPTLLKMCQTVSETIDKFDVFLTSVRWKAPIP